jgi:hypothetical protein
MQYLSPRPNRAAVPGGGVAVVHKLWKAMFPGRV